jgi:hypothetical protein
VASNHNNYEGVDMTDAILTQEYLKSIYKYDGETGIFTRLKPHPRWKVGQVAGTDNGSGYIRISINYKQVYAHRLAWLYVHGVMPKKTIDHINGNRSDNRICNLRAITKAENNQNMPMFKTNKSGLTGVHWSKSRNRWVAQISVNNINKRLGRFVSKEEAYNAYLKAKEIYHSFANFDRLEQA